MTYDDMVGMLLCSCCLVDLVLFWQAALWTCLAQRLHGHNKQSQSCWWVLRRGLETPHRFRKLCLHGVNGVTSVTSSKSTRRQDFFKGQKSSAEYLAASKSYVPPNSRTAILYVTRPNGWVSHFCLAQIESVLPDRSKVRQMQHMPQKALLQLA